MEKRRIKIEIAYDGSNYSGWQTQADVPTVQKTIELKLEKILRHKVSLLGSGRTDAGVHALKQVATFSTDSYLSTPIVHKALNAHLPHDIRVYSAVDVPMAFHPINDVISKRYRYLIDDSRPFFPFFKNYCWAYYKPLSLERMQKAAEFLIGTHDFSCFESQGSPRESSVRTIFDVKIERTDIFGPFAYSLKETSFLSFEIAANGFLYNMARAIVGTLALIGESESARKGSRSRGKAPIWMQEMLASTDRKEAGPTAPAHGLYLADVKYPDSAFSSHSLSQECSGDTL